MCIKLERESKGEHVARIALAMGKVTHHSFILGTLEKPNFYRPFVIFFRQWHRFYSINAGFFRVIPIISSLNDNEYIYQKKNFCIRYIYICILKLFLSSEKIGIGNTKIKR